MPQRHSRSSHSAKDGFDVAFFAFPDSTIVRRAVVHVDPSGQRPPEPGAV